MSIYKSKNYLTTGRAAEFLGVHPTTVNDWLNKDRCEYFVTPGGVRLIPIDEIHRMKEMLTKRRGGRRLIRPEDID